MAPSSKKWPPVAPGFVRVDWLGVDVRSPGELDGIEVDRPVIEWDGPRGACQLRLQPGGAQVVGTLPLTCWVSGEGCGSCGEIRPIPGGPAEEPYPTEPPSIEITGAWSDHSTDRSGLFVWLDGTVQWNGMKCHGYRGRRGRLPAGRAATLVAALELGGLLDHHPQRPHRAQEDPECDHTVIWFVLRAGGRENVIQSDCDPDPRTRAAQDLVDQVVGPTPCAYDRR